MENGRLAILDRRNRLICSIIRSFRHPMLRKIILPTAIPKIKASFPEQTRVVVSEGIFDLLHDGHRTSLEHAKAQGDVLCVLVGTDAYARTKGGRKTLSNTNPKVKCNRKTRLCKLRYRFD